MEDQEIYKKRKLRISPNIYSCFVHGNRLLSTSTSKDEEVEFALGRRRDVSMTVEDEELLVALAAAAGSPSDDDVVWLNSTQCDDDLFK